MVSFKSLLVVALSTGVLSQRPTDMPICDYYTTALLKNNTGANQYTLLTLLVNTVVIGNYTKPNVGIAVPGILAKGQFNGQDVNLLPYFNGMLASSNRGGDMGVSVNFLDDGGAAPLKDNKPANGMSSQQYKLLTHLYQFFGSLLGCSKYGMEGFPAYTGQKSMSQVHRFMALGPAEVGYFITQVGLAAASFGVTEADAKAVGMALNKLFGNKCSPPTTVIKDQGPADQSICIADACPIDPSPMCSAYPAVVKPKASNMTMNASSTMSASATATTAAMQTANAAPKIEMLGSAAAVVGAAVLLAVGL